MHSLISGPIAKLERHPRRVPVDACIAAAAEKHYKRHNERRQRASLRNYSVRHADTGKTSD